MDANDLDFRDIRQADLVGLAETFSNPPSNKPAEKWHELLAEQEFGHRAVLVVRHNDRVVGYGTLRPRSNYQPFREAGIPEIADLNVGYPYRRRGIGGLLITRLEERAKRREYETIGIEVGLDEGYGPAQRLYAKLGYAADGRGITSRHEPVRWGQRVRVDDDLNLWLTKRLKSL